jgi:hypothetical protein
MISGGTLIWCFGTHNYKYKIKRRKMILLGYTDVKPLKNFCCWFSQIIDYANELTSEMKLMPENLGKHDLKAQNKVLGNFEVL